MQTQRTLTPGQKGSKKFLERFCKRLVPVCDRYASIAGPNGFQYYAQYFPHWKGYRGGSGRYFTKADGIDRCGPQVIAKSGYPSMIGNRIIDENGSIIRTLQINDIGAIPGMCLCFRRNFAGGGGPREHSVSRTGAIGA